MAADENHPPPPLSQPEQFSLRDGSIVTIRPIRPDDAARLQAGFARLSTASIYDRFHRFRKELPRSEAEELANVDYITRMAFVAVQEAAGGPSIVGVARYERIESGAPGTALCAIVVADYIHRQRLGSTLLKRLAAYARSQGISIFAGTILNSNDAVLGFVRHSGLSYRVANGAGGVLDVYIELGSEA